MKGGQGVRIPLPTSRLPPLSHTLSSLSTLYTHYIVTRTTSSAELNDASLNTYWGPEHEQGKTLIHDFEQGQPRSPATIPIRSGNAPPPILLST